MHDASTVGSDRTKVIVIGMFAAVVVAAVAGGYWFFKIHQPATRLADAQAEILAWDHRFTELRTCLLGKSPGSSKVSEALAIRELSPDPWERKTCTQLVSQLSRGEAEDTRVPAVEEAWRVLDKAFVSHVDPGGDQLRKKPDPLPVALDELEAAYAALRAAAKLPTVSAAIKGRQAMIDGKPLPAAQIIPVTLGDKRILTIQEPYVPSRTGMLAFGTVDGAEVQFQFAAGKPPVVTAVGAGTQRAIPDGTWGARALPDAIDVGQLDAAGTMAAPAKLALPGPTQVLAVVGTWADGVIVYGAGNQMVVARCKAGACTPVENKPYLVRSIAFATDAATGDTTLVWSDATGCDKETSRACDADVDGGRMRVLRLVASALDTRPQDLTWNGFPKLVCLTADSAWLQYMLAGNVETVELMKDGNHAAAPDDEHGLMGCSPGGAVLYKDFGEPSYRRCANGKCDAALTGSQKHRVPVAVTVHGIVGVETRGAVMAVRKGGPTDFYAVPNGLVPLVAMTDGNTLDTLAWTADGLVIARASAR